MSAFVKCDGCGKEAQMEEATHQFFKPRHWYQRSDDGGIQVACSRQCIEHVAAESGKTRLVLPV